MYKSEVCGERQDQYFAFESSRQGRLQWLERMRVSFASNMNRLVENAFFDDGFTIRLVKNIPTYREMWDFTVVNLLEYGYAVQVERYKDNKRYLLKTRTAVERLFDDTLEQVRAWIDENEEEEEEENETGGQEE